MDLNYKLLYEVQNSGLRVDTYKNIQTRHLNKASKEADAEYKHLTDFLCEKLGPDIDFEITNIHCMTSAGSHVYTWKKGERPSRGNGFRVCCFCGNDDFDF